MLSDIRPDRGLTPLVSVVVPVYNVDKYLAECLDSLVNQTYHPIEIIAINDASTDNSLAILRRYQLMDNRIIVIDNLTNRSLGCVRNIGIERAKGRFIFFIDSDDCLESDTIRRVVGQMGDTVDICIFNGQAFREDVSQRSENRYIAIKAGFLDKGCSSDEVRYKLACCCHSACMKAYDLSFLRKHRLRFPEGIYGEDVEFWIHCLTLTSNISYCDYMGYFRRIREGSIMTSNPEKNLADRMSNLDALLALCQDDIPLYNYVAGDYIPYIRYQVLQLGNQDLIGLLNQTINRLVARFE